ncbi:MAG: GNAT family N-acetyltransferase [Lachnospiraceae bacterium]|nr:GNAT family N-acetyltransferase [Lachnospiraceae bacterium]
MIINTKRLTLRPLGVKDLKSVHAYAGDSENCKYMLFLPNETEEKTLEFLMRAEKQWNSENPAYYEFAIEFEGKHIGAISLWLLEDGETGELGWVIHKDFWGRGIVTEAATAMIEFAGTLNLKKLIAQCDCRNIGSAKVMEKIGMVLLDDTGVRTYEKNGESAKELTYGIEI